MYTLPIMHFLNKYTNGQPNQRCTEANTRQGNQPTQILAWALPASVGPPRLQ